MRGRFPQKSADLSMASTGAFQAGLNPFMPQRVFPGAVDRRSLSASALGMQVPAANLGLAAMKFANGGTLPREEEHRYIPLEERKTVSEFIDGDDSSDEEITLPVIIKKKPPPKVVREFLRDYVADIKSEEQLIFE